MKIPALGKEIWDEKVSGLHLRHLPSGRKTFYLYYRTKQGRERRPKIGDLGTVGLQGARDIARSLLRQVAQGEDPVANWSNSRAEKTVNELFSVVQEKVWSKLKSRWPREAKNLYLKNIKPSFGHLKLSEVRRVSVRNWHADMHETPFSANRSLEVLSRMFRYAKDHELLAGDNPIAGISSYPERKRRSFASPEELRSIGNALRKRADSDPRGVAYLYALIFSGCRPLDLEKAKATMLQRLAWKDGEWFGMLTIEGKTSEATGEQEVIVIPPIVMKFFNTLPVSDAPFGRFPRKLWDEIREEAGCKHLWARDFRRLFGVTGLSNGLNLDGIGELLNHKSAQTTHRYTDLFQKKRLEMALLIAKKLEESLSPAPSCEGAEPVSNRNEGFASSLRPVAII